MDHEKSTGRHAVTNAEFVIDVWIENGNIGNDGVRGDEFEIHVGSNITRAFLFVCPERHAPGFFESRLNEQIIDVIKVDVQGRCSLHFFRAEGHDDKHVRFHVRPLFGDRVSQSSTTQVHFQ